MRHPIIIISGTPATGKTTLALDLSKQFSYDYIDGKQIIEEYQLIEEYDKEQQTNIIDDKKFLKILESIITKSKKPLIIDSHLAHDINPKYADIVIITTCDKKIIVDRMKERGYSDQKIADNIEAENFDTCFIEAQESGHSPIKINTMDKKAIEKLKETISSFQPSS